MTPADQRLARVVRDMDAARRDPLAFADLAGVELSEAQARAIRGPVLGEGPLISALLAPRQTGKSRALALAVSHAVTRRAGVRVLVVSASEDAAKRLMTEIRGILTSPALQASIVDETSTMMRLSNGSEVRCTTSSERAIRGWTVDLLVLDEAAMIGDDLLTGAALPTVAATGGRVLAASSAGPAYGWFFDAVQRGRAGSEHVAFHEWTLNDAPWVSPSTISALRDSMSEIKFAAEFQNVFAGTGSLYFGDGRMIRACIADVQAPRLAGLGRGNARGWFGLDPSGEGADRTALAGFVRVPGASRPGTFLLAEALALDSFAPLSGPGSISDTLTSCRAPIGVLSVESNGVGTYLVPHLVTRLRERPGELGGTGGPFRTITRAVTTSGESKSAMFAAARVMFEQGSIVIPAELDDLVRELLLLGVGMTETGREKIAATSGHDDLAMAFALALTPHIVERSRIARWHVLLAEWADGSRPIPEPAGDVDGEGEWVKTPGGVELQARPVLQSIAGPELTHPSGPGPGHISQLTPR